MSDFQEDIFSNIPSYEELELYQPTERILKDLAFVEVDKRNIPDDREKSTFAISVYMESVKEIRKQYINRRAEERAKNKLDVQDTLQEIIKYLYDKPTLFPEKLSNIYETNRLLDLKIQNISPTMEEAKELAYYYRLIAIEKAMIYKYDQDKRDKNAQK